MERIGNLYIHENRNQNKIALTFDDGPCEETREILKVLKKYDVRATFFVLGKKIKGNEQILKQIINQGCEIGNHSENHYALWWKRKGVIEKEILETDKKLKILDIKTDIFRPPYMRFGLNLLMTCKRLNKKIIAYDVASNDWRILKKEIIIQRIENLSFEREVRLFSFNSLTHKNKGLSQTSHLSGGCPIVFLIKRVLKKIKNGSIINFHDYVEDCGRNKSIVEIINKLVPILKKKYELVTISEVLK